MDKNSTILPGITFTGNITVNGPMFDIHDNQHVHINTSQPHNSQNDDQETPNTHLEEEIDLISNQNLLASRQEKLEQLLALVDKGDWRQADTAEKVKTMLKTVLGLNSKQKLTAQQAALSDKMWHLLENGRSDRVKIVWQNLIGYLDEKNLFNPKGSPALNKDFFNNDTGYPNIDKGRPRLKNLSAGFSIVLPLLDAFAPK